jgi:hypothetical protein
MPLFPKVFSYFRIASKRGEKEARFVPNPRRTQDANPLEEILLTRFGQTANNSPQRPPGGWVRRSFSDPLAQGRTKPKSACFLIPDILEIRNPL